MAEIARINLADGTSQLGVNITHSVGTGGANQYRDVLLIQALLQFIGKARLGLGPDYALPQPTGMMDAETYSAIGEFQIANSTRLLIRGFGWRIHPANYRGRKLRLVGRKLMAITLLHVLAEESARTKGGEPYPEALAKMHPDLNAYLDGGFGVRIGQITLEKDFEVIIGPIELEPEIEVTIGRVILE